MSRSKGERATLDAVAERAGVSKATASKVLNHRPGVSAATRQRVERAMSDLDYAPTTQVREPRETATVTLVFDTLISLYSLRVLEGAIDEAKDDGVDLMTTTLLTEGREPVRLDPAWAESVAAKGHAGVLVVTSRIHGDLVRACDRLGLALVAVDPPNDPEPPVVSVGSHHWGGGRQATAHLLDLGHRRIAFVGGANTNLNLRERFAGYREALDAAGVALDPALVSHEGMGSAGRVALRMLERAGPRPTAIFATTDSDAFNVIRAVESLGLRVPRDVSVIGYDDTYAAVPTSTELSTVRTPMREIGGLALRTLMGLVAGDQPVSRQVKLATGLVARETTAAPPAD
ncbi:substrate-binding domain-containing protein [Actinoplanes sp. NBRC 101535]|uniref:LacI family DNA-binding transcriptional regulator n=1 Tax=Actinoplanes sp. NBRC 101535 TaxID=3032196 RepID=UPI0024A11E13|nr:substrate-binding domain-containing protein [Actinoplanes sp. NBRC 101535]GLY06742.1 transcriptional regulator [Actinoplanes sp. NBRC 101535]